jgi:hypothetical protein
MILHSAGGAERHGRNISCVELNHCVDDLGQAVFNGEVP